MNHGSTAHSASPFDDSLSAIRALVSAGQVRRARNELDALLHRGGLTADQWHRAGGIYEAMMAWGSALAAYEQSATSGRRDEELWVDLAVAAQRAHRFDRALVACDHALKSNPESVAAMNQKGLIHQDLGQATAAMACFKQALVHYPDSHEIYNNIGSLYFDGGDFSSAESAFNRALSLSNQQSIQAQVNMGNVLVEQGRPDLAKERYETALSINPGFVTARFNLGMALQEMGEPDAALAAFQQALDQRPDYAEACGQLAYALRRLCLWDGLPEVDAMLDRFTSSALNGRGRMVEQPFVALVRHDDPEYQYHVARAWSTRIQNHMDDGSSFRPRWTTGEGEVLRIGYLSGNFRDHPLGYLTAGLFAAHDRQKFSVFGYGYGKNDGSGVRRRIQDGCDTFVDLDPLSPLSAAQRIHDDGIDILVDLMGHTKGHRMAIPACRPAPIQVRYLGLAGTTGAPWFDYLVVDPIVCPEVYAEYYSEALVHMPHTYQVNDRNLAVSDHRWERSDWGLPPEPAIVFCCFNQPYKIDPVIFDAWLTLLRQVPGSVLWLIAGPSTAQRSLCARAQAAGLDPDRLIFASKLPKADHLARLPLADVALDTRTVTGAATTTDALRMGVPVITLAGRQFAANMSASILSSIGLTQLVTPSISAYVAAAADLAVAPEHRRRLQSWLRKTVVDSILFDTDGFARRLEYAFGEMARRCRDGESPGLLRIPEGTPTRGGIS